MPGIVATVPTVYGIETDLNIRCKEREIFRLQQYLPFTVLKLYEGILSLCTLFIQLQQYLPFTVLKRGKQTHVCV